MCARKKQNCRMVMTITAVNEMYKASHIVHFVSDDQITQPLSVVGQVVTERNVPCFCGII